MARRGNVVKFDRRPRERRFGRCGQGISLAFGVTGTRLDGLLFVSRKDGQLTVVDVVSLNSTLLATGGSRGAFLVAGGDGRLYIASTTGVDVLFPAKPPAVIASGPKRWSGCGKPDQSYHGDVRLDDVPRHAGGSRSVLNPANYHITDMATGQGVSVGAVVYDQSARRAELVFEPLAPSSYELQV